MRSVNGYAPINHTTTTTATPPPPPMPLDSGRFFDFCYREIILQTYHHTNSLQTFNAMFSILASHWCAEWSMQSVAIPYPCCHHTSPMLFESEKINLTRSDDKINIYVSCNHMFPCKAYYLSSNMPWSTMMYAFRLGANIIEIGSLELLYTLLVLRNLSA